MNTLQQRSYPNIGDVVFQRSPRAKRINISLKPFEPVRVSVPYSAPISHAEAFLKQKTAWIIKARQKMEKLEQRYTVFTIGSDYRTRSHQLQLAPEKRADYRVAIDNGQLKVVYPEQVSDKDPYLQDVIRRALEKVWSLEASAELPGRVNRLAQQHGFVYRSITVRNTKTRWGSCTHDNRLNFSLHIMRLPDHLIDYIILHELCHTKVKNHGPKFWALLQQVSGDARGLDKAVKQYSTKIY